MTSNQLVERLYRFVQGVVASGMQSEEMEVQSIREFLEQEYCKEDREIALGLAFSRWNGPELSAFVAALDIPREQRMYIRKAGSRLEQDEPEKTKQLLRKILSMLRASYSDLGHDVSQALTHVATAHSVT